MFNKLLTDSLQMIEKSKIFDYTFDAQTCMLDKLRHLPESVARGRITQTVISQETESSFNRVEGDPSLQDTFGDIDLSMLLPSDRVVIQAIRNKTVKGDLPTKQDLIQIGGSYTAVTKAISRGNHVADQQQLGFRVDRVKQKREPNRIAGYAPFRYKFTRVLYEAGEARPRTNHNQELVNKHLAAGQIQRTIPKSNRINEAPKPSPSNLRKDPPLGDWSYIQFGWLLGDKRLYQDTSLPAKTVVPAHIVSLIMENAKKLSAGENLAILPAQEITIGTFKGALRTVTYYMYENHILNLYQLTLRLRGR